MKRVRIGDIIEIPTAKGIAYAHYTHRHPLFGGLIRVFDQLFDEPQSDFSGLVEGPIRFSTFIPIGTIVNRGIFRVSGHYEVALANQPFPIFRNGNADPITRKVAVWWLWDGEKEWRVGALRAEQRSFPMLGVWNDTMLVERIESGWTPEKDLR